LVAQTSSYQAGVGWFEEPTAGSLLRQGGATLGPNTYHLISDGYDVKETAVARSKIVDEKSDLYLKYSRGGMGIGLVRDTFSSRTIVKHHIFEKNWAASLMRTKDHSDSNITNVAGYFNHPLNAVGRIEVSTEILDAFDDLDVLSNDFNYDVSTKDEALDDYDCTGDRIIIQCSDLSNQPWDPDSGPDSFGEPGIILCNGGVPKEEFLRQNSLCYDAHGSIDSFASANITAHVGRNIAIGEVFGVFATLRKGTGQLEDVSEQLTISNLTNFEAVQPDCTDITPAPSVPEGVAQSVAEECYLYAQYSRLFRLVSNDTLLSREDINLEIKGLTATVNIPIAN